MSQTGGQGGQLPPQILADQKAPPGSGGAPHYYLPHRMFDPWCIPAFNLFFPPKLNYISVSLAVMANLGLVCIAELMPASNKLSNTVKLTYSRPPKLFDVTDLNWWKTLYVSLH
jgi:hypothetical protein